MKQLKDYIHHYIGCEVMTPQGKAVLHAVYVNGFVRVVFYHMSSPIGYSSIEIQPFLRHLKDMPEEDAPNYNEEMNQATDRQAFEEVAEIIRKLTKMGYDCYGLIDAGLAIDAATLNNKTAPEGDK